MRRVLGVPLRPVVDRPYGDALVRAELRVVEALRQRREEELRRGEVHLRREMVGGPDADRGRAAVVERRLDLVGDQVERLVPGHLAKRAALGVAHLRVEVTLGRVGQRVRLRWCRR